uniref:Uncharacterized protein n=1 Tax=Glossina palpalis gambiensis TaxID=67801 RepID=A0A1B0AWE9_9MUSC
MELISNAKLSKHFINVEHGLDIIELKIPGDMHKFHLDNVRNRFAPMQVSKENLAASFVTGFVNDAFALEKLPSKDDNKWLYKNEEHGMLSTIASLEC